MCKGRTAVRPRLRLRKGTAGRRVMCPPLRQRRTPAWHPFPAARSLDQPAATRPASPHSVASWPWPRRSRRPTGFEDSVPPAVRGGTEVKSLVERSRKTAAGRAPKILEKVRVVQQLDLIGRARSALDELSFEQRQKLVRLMVEEVRVAGYHVDIRLRIPLDQSPDDGPSDPSSPSNGVPPKTMTTKVITVVRHPWWQTRTEVPRRGR
jgi:hypothetical protein